MPKTDDFYLTRGPRMGEDILAWAREEIDDAIAWVFQEGLLVVTMSDERVSNVIPPVIRFLRPDSSVDDEIAEKSLADAIQDQIRYATDVDGSIEGMDRQRMELLRDVLREKADLIDRHLAVVPEPKREPKWGKLPQRAFLLRRPNLGLRALHELSHHVSLRELLMADVEELAERVESLPIYGPKLRGLMLEGIPDWREELKRSGEFDALAEEAGMAD